MTTDASTGPDLDRLAAEKVRELASGLRAAADTLLRLRHHLPLLAQTSDELRRAADGAGGFADLLDGIEVTGDMGDLIDESRRPGAGPEGW
jgi:hypothetical protein